MIRSTIFAAAALSVAVLTTGCNNAADEQAKAEQAQAQANEKAAQARADADAKARAAQADADKKIADAQASFDKMREDYRHTLTNDLTDIDKRIADLDAKKLTATGKTRSDLDVSLTAVHGARERLTADFNNLGAASASTWDRAKANLDKEYSDLRSMIRKAETGHVVSGS
jgi:chromosome segregation ATPase